MPIGFVFVLGSFLMPLLNSECIGACSSIEQLSGYLPWFLFFFIVGMLFLWDGYNNFKPKTNRPVATISKETLSPGDRFKFSYKLRCQKAQEFGYVGVYLVFRETIEYYNVSEWENKTFDRQVQEFSLPNASCQAGETLEIGCDFEIPNRDMGLRHPFKNLNKAQPAKTSWHIKIFMKRTNSWSEYDLDVQGTASVNGPTMIEEADLYDLYLMGKVANSMLSLSKALSRIVPHTNASFGDDSLVVHPYLLLERLTRAEAEAAKDELEAAGGIIELCPAGNSPASEK